MSPPVLVRPPPSLPRIERDPPIQHLTSASVNGERRSLCVAGDSGGGEEGTEGPVPCSEVNGVIFGCQRPITAWKEEKREREGSLCCEPIFVLSCPYIMGASPILRRREREQKKPKALIDVFGARRRKTGIGQVYNISRGTKIGHYFDGQFLYFLLPVDK